jgi:hypothetical protein
MVTMNPETYLSWDEDDGMYLACERKQCTTTDGIVTYVWTQRLPQYVTVEMAAAVEAEHVATHTTEEP